MNESNILEILFTKHVGESHSISSPMVHTCKLSKFGVDLLSNPTLYCSMVGALQYLVRIKGFKQEG